MGKSGFTLRIRKGFEITLGMPTELAKSLTDGDANRLERPLDVLDMSIEERGFLFVLADEAGSPDKDLLYQPEHFDTFLTTLSAVGMPRAAILKLNSDGAAKILRIFGDWLNHKQAEVFERNIRAGNMTFEEAREIRKEAFDVPRFAQFFKDSWLAGDMPKGRRGKRRTYDRNVEELYSLACRLYRETPDLSWEAACYSATEQRPDLVPSSWRSDPDGNLKREAARYWDKSIYSQLSYRQSRDR